MQFNFKIVIPVAAIVFAGCSQPSKPAENNNR
jgi:hypothetical protein